ncbi:hypothetical protein [Microtetraspora malaysiensis]|uniref:hypothetical protein n=1 Tax=Microtetraspora malaysiensis TaxID=161358 RepID=UPI0008330008|nr:hypothetical protein [Microtetraspora malaysiensis]
MAIAVTATKNMDVVLEGKLSKAARSLLAQVSSLILSIGAVLSSAGCGTDCASQAEQHFASARKAIKDSFPAEWRSSSSEQHICDRDDDPLLSISFERKVDAVDVVLQMKRDRWQTKITEKAVRSGGLAILRKRVDDHTLTAVVTHYPQVAGTFVEVTAGE